MAATLPHPPDTDRYATREELQAAVDGLMHLLDSVAAARGLPVLSPRHRSGLHLVASEGERLILEAART
ncbi:MAG TPA: hypothetical protein VGS62_03485 [Streptosporangiaceae bacterium]|nr:hypothetical protein [Streptosporangiaceae bacterium]